jgi:transaldolase
VNGSLRALTQAGVSVWLDDMSRARLRDGSLRELITDLGVSGVTTNPTIFAGAVSDSATYAEGLAELSRQGQDPEAATETLMVQDVAGACDVLLGIWESTAGVDGRVSIEVDPTLANQEEATVEVAQRLHDRVGRPNVLVKIPATKAGLPAIQRTLAAGVSVNVTLIFSPVRYREVLEAWAAGCEQALAAGVPAERLVSVASFFVSRVDTAVDPLLDQTRDPRAAQLRGGTGLANARLAHGVFRDFCATERVQALAASGVRLQRPLWASTGVKDPAYSPTMYVDGLVTEGTVNTLPEATLHATAAADPVSEETVVSRYGEAVAHFTELAEVGVDMDDVYRQLETEGVDKFIGSWRDLLRSVETGLTQS